MTRELWGYATVIFVAHGQVQLVVGNFHEEHVEESNPALLRYK